MPDNPLFYMRLKFLFGLVIFACVAFGSFALFHIYEQQQVTSAAEINLSGRQRMLSQRLALLGMQVDISQPGEARDRYIESFEDTLQRIRKSHTALTQGDPLIGISTPRSEKLKELYFHPVHGVDPLLKSYIKSAEQLLADHTGNFPSSLHDITHDHFTTFANLANEDFLTKLDKVVIQYQYDAEDRLEKFYIISIAFLVISFALVLFIWLAIFRPLIDSIIQYVHQLKSQTHELELAKHEADHANQVKAGFLSSMSHELRTPLNSILGYSQLMSMRPGGLSEKQIGYITQIETAGTHLLELINEILEYAKIEAGSAQVNIQTVDPANVLQECVDIAKPQARKNNVILIHEKKQHLPVVQADPMRLRQITLNLLSNAIKYNRPKGKAILKTELNCSNLRIIVQDTGLGISADNQEHIFEPFNRLGAEKSDVEGSGIGLVITQKLAEKMDGAIGFESAENVGSTFWIDIPLSKDS